MFKRIVFVVCFLAGACASTTSALPEMRMTPAEVRSGGSGEGQIGSSKLVDVHTRVLFGDPAKAGFYSILLFVPKNTTSRERLFGTGGHRPFCPHWRRARHRS